MISLEGSIRSCKVDTGYAPKIQSDRFFNPNVMLCPTWQHQDATGRNVCWDSFYTKTPGCNSARDIVLVENAQRPQYIEYVTLDASGIEGLDCGAAAQRANQATRCQESALDNAHKQTGQFGYNTGFMQSVRGNCVACDSYPDPQALGSQDMRNQQFTYQARRVAENRASAMW